MIHTLPPRFINWRMMDGRKVPCRPDGSTINPHDQANHLTYEQAAASPHPVGFAMRAEDGLFFLDLDKCATADGQWSHAAVAMWQSFSGAMGEVSTSGTGLHILGRCDPSRLADRRNKWGGWLEFYTDGRFIAFGKGWQPIGGTYTDKDWTDQIIRVVPQREFLGPLPDGRDPAYTGPEDDDQLIAMMLRSKSTSAAFGGVSVADLWQGNAAALATQYPAYDGKGGFDHSSADAALMSHLAFWTGKDMPRMDRLFRRSALMRDKYEKRDDYRRDTIQNAARLCKRVYDRAPAPTLPGLPATATVETSEAWLSVPEMIEHFKGCVYVRDMHRVFIPDGSLLKPEQFNAVYGGHVFQIMADGTKPTTEAFKALTQCTVHRFPQAKRTCFRADMKEGTIMEDEVNVYVDPEVVFTQGDVTPFLRHMQKLVPDPGDLSILLSWCAALVQYPGVKFQWAPVIQGVEGNGKSLLASCLMYAIGNKYAYEPRSSQLTSQFISFDEHKLLIVCEEIHMGGRRDMLDELKTRITNRRVEVEAKGQDKRLIVNTANWMFCTNHRDAVIKSRNDRRYAIFFTAQQFAQDLTRDGMGGSYFPDLYEWLRTEGGYAAVAYYLKTYPIPDHLNPATQCHRAPVTTSTEAAISATIGGLEAEILEAIESGQPGFRGGYVSSYALDKLIEDRRLRVSRPKRGEILRDMGYVNLGRSPSPIVSENGVRPNIWSRNPMPDHAGNYCAAQGPGYA